MRDILFRGKRLDKKDEWVEGGIVHQTDFYGDSVDRHYIIDGTDTDDNIGPAYRVHPDTIGQYTGLTDRNGKRIFGGDIIKAADASPEYSLVVIRDEGYGFFNDYYFGGEWYDTEPICGVDWFLCDEIIGNIHDNPELLEVTE